MVLPPLGDDDTNPEIQEYIQNFNPEVAGLVFLAALAIDAASTLYTRRCVEGKAVQAANISAGLLVLSAVTLYLFIENPLYLVGEAAGAWLGTFVTCKIDHKRKEVTK